MIDLRAGGSLFGLQASNPVDTNVAYGGSPSNYAAMFNWIMTGTDVFAVEGTSAGEPNDPMVGLRIGGINVFGGGLALYDASGRPIGGLGVSGDSSCADHNIAWRTRNLLSLDGVPAGVSGDDQRDDNIVYDITPQAGQMPGVSASGWGHPACSAAAVAIAATLPPTN